MSLTGLAKQYNKVNQVGSSDSFDGSVVYSIILGVIFQYMSEKILNVEGTKHEDEFNANEKVSLSCKFSAFETGWCEIFNCGKPYHDIPMQSSPNIQFRLKLLLVH